jgi:hypothetical protein
MLDLDTLPVQPAQVDGHRRSPHQDDKHDGHHREDGAPIVAYRGDPTLVVDGRGHVGQQTTRIGIARDV